MVKGSELLGLPILENNKVKTHYYVEELIFCKKRLKLLGIYVKQKNFSHKEYKVIPFNKVESINKQGLIISSKNDILFPYQISNIEDIYKEPIKVLGFHIYNSEGNLVGVIKDIIIQEKSGKIIAFIISEGIYDDLIKGYSLLPILNDADFQKDHLIISDRELQCILSQGGGLKKLFGIE